MPGSHIDEILFELRDQPGVSDLRAYIDDLRQQADLAGLVREVVGAVKEGAAASEDAAAILARVERLLERYAEAEADHARAAQQLAELESARVANRQGVILRVLDAVSAATKTRWAAVLGGGLAIWVLERLGLGDAAMAVVLRLLGGAG